MSYQEILLGHNKYYSITNGDQLFQKKQTTYVLYILKYKTFNPRIVCIASTTREDTSYVHGNEIVVMMKS